MMFKETKIPIDRFLDNVQSGDEIFGGGIHVTEKTKFYALIKSYYGKFTLIEEYDNGVVEEHELTPSNIYRLPTSILPYMEVEVPHEFLITFEKVPVKFNLRWYSLSDKITQTNMLIHAEIILDTKKEFGE